MYSLSNFQSLLEASLGMSLFSLAAPIFIDHWQRHLNRQYAWRIGKAREFIDDLKEEHTEPFLEIKVVGDGLNTQIRNEIDDSLKKWRKLSLLALAAIFAVLTLSSFRPDLEIPAAVAIVAIVLLAAPLPCTLISNARVLRKYSRLTDQTYSPILEPFEEAERMFLKTQPMPSILDLKRKNESFDWRTYQEHKRKWNQDRKSFIDKELASKQDKVG